MLAGCSMTTAPRRVLVIGDSITALAQPDLSTTLDRSYTVGYVFRISVRIEPMLGLVESDLQDNIPTAAVVINLGTNDAIAGGNGAPALASFAQLLTTVGSVGCVVLTTIGPFADVRGGSDVGASLNRKITDLVAGDPRRYKLVDWNRFLSTLESQTRQSYLQSDLIHETAAGASWIAASDEAALHTCGTTARTPMIQAPRP
jgi:hypothetical protein